MTQTLSMSALYQKLTAIGFPKKFVREKALPSWWNDELNDKPLAVLEGAGHIAKRLHLDLTSLLDDLVPQFKPLPRTKFKYHDQNHRDVPTTAQQLASRVAEIVACSTNIKFKSIPSDPRQIRSEIVSKHPQVTLYSLLDYCWQQGIAVIYFNDYPSKIRKITGIIQWLDERPVIVLSSGKTEPACLAFHLAHELGHLALGHIQEGILVDDKIEKDSDDQEENDSNQFAVSLLIGDFDNHLKKTFKNANQLKTEILKVVQIDKTIDPSALTWNYGWNKDCFGLATKCVSFLTDPKSDGKQTINDFLEKHINWDSLSDDNTDYLEQILGE
jgi:Zn-dependent peptidase ImmA (M78 family)